MIPTFASALSSHTIGSNLPLLTRMPPPEVIVGDRLILAIDIGSSSIRCSAYGMVTSDDDKGSASTSRGVVASVEGCSSSIKMQGVEPNTGKVRIYRKYDGGD